MDSRGPSGERATSSTNDFARLDSCAETVNSELAGQVAHGQAESLSEAYLDNSERFECSNLSDEGTYFFSEAELQAEWDSFDTENHWIVVPPFKRAHIEASRPSKTVATLPRQDKMNELSKDDLRKISDQPDETVFPGLQQPSTYPAAPVSRQSGLCRAADNGQKLRIIGPTFKVALLGNSGVGKTSLVRQELGKDPGWPYLSWERRTEGIPPESLEITCMVQWLRGEFKQKVPTEIEIRLLDTPGKVNPVSMHTIQAVKEADVVVVVFNVHSRASFNSVERWKALADAYADGKPTVLLGNCSEYSNMCGRHVTIAEGVTLKDTYNFTAYTEAACGFRVLYQKHSDSERSVHHFGFQNMLSSIIDLCLSPSEMRNMRKQARLLRDVAMSRREDERLKRWLFVKNQ